MTNQDYELASSLVLYVFISYMSEGTYNSKLTPNDIFLRSFSWQYYLFWEFLPEMCSEEAAEEIFSYFFILLSGLALEVGPYVY